MKKLVDFSGFSYWTDQRNGLTVYAVTSKGTEPKHGYFLSMGEARASIGAPELINNNATIGSTVDNIITNGKSRAIRSVEDPIGWLKIDCGGSTSLAYFPDSERVILTIDLPLLDELKPKLDNLLCRGD